MSKTNPALQIAKRRAAQLRTVTTQPDALVNTSNNELVVSAPLPDKPPASSIRVVSAISFEAAVSTLYETPISARTPTQWKTICIAAIREGRTDYPSPESWIEWAEGYGVVFTTEEKQQLGISVMHGVDTKLDPEADYWRFLMAQEDEITALKLEETNVMQTGQFAKRRAR